MRMVLVICLCHSLSSNSYSDLKKWCRGDRSCASSALVVRRSLARPAIPPCLPLMASSIASMGDQDEVALGSQQPVVAPVPRVLSAGGATQGASDIGVVGPPPHLGDDAGSSLWDFVLCGTGIGVPGSAIPSDVAPTPGSSSVVGPRISGLHLPGSPGFPPPPINLRWVGDEAEFACSQVAIVKRLLHETLVSWFL
jgi:hypothetical protein